MALVSTAPTLEEAHASVTAAAQGVPVLEWRREVGDSAYLEGLSGHLAPRGAEDGTPSPAARP